MSSIQQQWSDAYNANEAPSPKLARLVYGMVERGEILLSEQSPVFQETYAQYAELRATLDRLMRALEAGRDQTKTAEEKTTWPTS